MRSGTEFFLGEEKMAHTQQSYKYLGVTFKRPSFFLQGAICAQVSHGYAAFGALERQCTHEKFQELQTNCGYLICFVTLTPLRTRTLGLGLHKVNN